MKKSLLDWLSYMQSIHVSAIDMGLERVLPVAEQLDLINSAKNSYVFTVAGTNGKGSTTAVIAEVCQQAGYKTALYQSPHLLKFNERVQINGETVSDQILITAFEQVEQARLACDLSLSFFEMTTLAAFLIFAQADCDVWVLEIGLGGRLDVVNIIEPNMTVITNVGIDHVDWLGDDREKIGYEKGGILRAGVPLVYGEVDMPSSVQSRIEELAIDCYQFNKDFNFLASSNQQTWAYSSANSTYNLSVPKLSLVNASNAITALLASALPITAKHINRGLESVQLIGRLDVRTIAKCRWVFDVAHNQAGVEFLLNQLPTLINNLGNKDHQDNTQNNPKNSHQKQGKIKVIFSMLKDKEIASVVQQLNTGLTQLMQTAGIDSHANIDWYVASIDPTYNHRSADIDLLTEAMKQQINTDNIHVFSDLDEATKQVIQEAKEGELTLVCGSFYTIAECLEAIDSIKVT